MASAFFALNLADHENWHSDSPSPSPHVSAYLRRDVFQHIRNGQRGLQIGLNGKAVALVATEHDQNYAAAGNGDADLFAHISAEIVVLAGSKCHASSRISLVAFIVSFQSV